MGPCGAGWDVVGWGEVGQGGVEWGGIGQGGVKTSLCEMRYSNTWCLAMLQEY